MPTAERGSAAPRNAVSAAPEAPASERDAPTRARSAAAPSRGLSEVKPSCQAEHSPKHQPWGFAKLRPAALANKVQLLGSAPQYCLLPKALGFAGRLSAFSGVLTPKPDLLLGSGGGLYPHEIRMLFHSSSTCLRRAWLTPPAKCTFTDF